ncbi:hypothetical protein HK098_002966 [Nowakowskiella sp. JEL0407]|nr:hypothetical protein HK098_002966 [Nowakowskiella sp. JEL0407]
MDKATPQITPIEAFNESIQHILSRWVSLRLVAEHNPPSHILQSRLPPFPTLRSEIQSILFDFFQTHGATVTIDELSDNLLEYFSSDLETELEDGSEVGIAEMLVEAYKQVIVKRNFAWFEDLRRQANEIDAKVVESLRRAGGRVEEDAENASDDDEVEDAEREDNGSGSMDVEMDEKNENSYIAPVVDEDGFELVQRKKGGRRK